MENGWFQRHVVESLQRLEEKTDKIEADVVQLKVAKAVHEEKQRARSALYGVLGGFLPALAALIYFLLRSA